LQASKRIDACAAVITGRARLRKQWLVAAQIFLGFLPDAGIACKSKGMVVTQGHWVSGAFAHVFFMVLSASFRERNT